ncbi:MFS transporter [Paenibacillus yanchengensis]|uniref:MFS transporter n=1 Tax=Paenibacillus yanchengensis TaxID=2035833 RepID=A0ABW4YGX2_9BACL
MNRLLMMVAICLGAFVSHFTAGVINVSLPQFATIFETNLATVQWVTTGYLLVIASLLPLMGKLGDRYSHRTIHNMGYILFTVSSILVAFSPNITILLLLRSLQALGASMFQATNIAIISIFLPKEMRGRALGVVSTAVALGAMSGPVAGGFIAEWLSWHWLFLIHVPIALIATILAWRYIPSRARKEVIASGTKVVQVASTTSKNVKSKFDFVGALLFIITMSTLILAISINQLSIFVVTLLGIIAFIMWERRQPVPFLSLDLFRSASLSGGMIVSVMTYMIANTVLVTLPFYLSGSAGLQPSTAGNIMATYPILLAIAGPIAGYLSDRFGSRLLMLIGTTSMMAALVLFVVSPAIAPIILLLTALFLLGIGMGLLSAPNNSFIMQHAPVEHVGAIGGMIALTRNLGMVVGAALGLGSMSFAGEGQGKLSLLHTLRPVFGSYILVALLVVIVLAVSLRSKVQGRKRQNV